MNTCVYCGDTIEQAVVLGALRWIHANSGNVSCELATATPDPGITRAICDVARERSTHVDLGWTPEHDAEHGVGHLLDLAGDYGDRAMANARPDRRDLVKAASLLVAAIELLDRSSATEEDR